MSNHGDVHWKGVLRILKYVSTSVSRGITYTSTVNTDTVIDELEVAGWSDAALGECPDTRQSRIGSVIMMNNAFIAGRSAKLKRQVDAKGEVTGTNITQVSSTGAELYALTNAGLEMRAVRNQLAELGRPVKSPSVLRGDNRSSIQVAHLPGKHSSSLRHLELRAFAIRSLIDEGELNVIWCSTDDQCSDLLTKPLGKEKYDKFSAILLGERTNSEVKRALISRFVTEFAADVSARNASRQAPPSGRTTGSALGGCVWAGATQPLSGSAGAQPRPGSRAPFGLPA